jgi:plasmid maintenance system antidote protein VapI
MKEMRLGDEKKEGYAVLCAVRIAHAWGFSLDDWLNIRYKYQQ